MAWREKRRPAAPTSCSGGRRRQRAPWHALAWASLVRLAVGEGRLSVPVVDVSAFSTGPEEVRQKIANAVDSAFSDFGFIVVTGHGVPETAFDGVYRAAKAFFRSPEAAKSRHDLGLGYGYGGYVGFMESGGQLAGENRSRADGVESLTLRGLHHLADEACRAGPGKPHFAQDLLPSVVSLHSALLSFKEVMTAVTELALGAPAGSLREIFEPRKGGLRLAYYPERPGGSSGHTVDYGAHADSASMVFLRLDRDNPEGTEVYHQGSWIPVPAVPGGLVVNLGTVLARLVGGRWKAALHRATRMGADERLSLVLGALVPPNDLQLGCLPAVCGTSADDSPRGSASAPTVKEYLDARVRLQRPETTPQDRSLVDFVDQLA